MLFIVAFRKANGEKKQPLPTYWSCKFPLSRKHAVDRDVKRQFTAAEEPHGWSFHILDELQNVHNDSLTGWCL